MIPAPFSVTLKKSAAKEFAGLPRPVQERVADRINEIAAEPISGRFPPLVNQDGTRKARVGGYRILFDADTERRVVTILAIGSRGSIYRGL